jgi:hypothetical protein
MEHILGHALNRPMRNDVVITRAANRLKLHMVTIVSPPEGYRPRTLEVAYTLSLQLNVQWQNISTSLACGLDISLRTS